MIHHGAVPVTAPARTILDLAAELSIKELHRLFENALASRSLRIDQLVTLVARSPPRPGIVALRALLEADHPPGIRVGRYEVDMLWLPQRLVVEMDGFAYHANRAAFERDRVRDAELQTAGYRVVRVTWRQIQDSREAVIARLAQALARSTWDLDAAIRSRRRPAVGASGASPERSSGDSG